MPTLTLFNTSKEEVGSISLAEQVFGVEVREHLFYEAVRYQLAKRRAGTHATKGRASVSGGGSYFLFGRCFSSIVNCWDSPFAASGWMGLSEFSVNGTCFDDCSCSCSCRRLVFVFPLEGHLKSLSFQHT